MALKPNETYVINGVTINEKIIPDGTVWKDGTKARKAGFSKGDLYKKQLPLNHKTGKPTKITVHNTKGHSYIADEGELYTRATYNENMSSARVHFYVDNNGAWQNLKAGTGMCKADPEGSCEVGWHAGDGSAQDGGNYQSIALEVIMGETAAIDAKAYDNGARIVAWLMWKHGITIDNVVTHTYWDNKRKKKIFADPDEQCCNPGAGIKWCPTFIFASTKKATAMKNWKAFKDVVLKYYYELSGEKPVTPIEPEEPEALKDIKVGDIVEFRGNMHYTNPNKLIGSKCTPGKAKVTHISKGSKHPYHLVRVDGGSTVYGWVDEKDIVTEAASEIMVGDKVRLKPDATIYGKTKKFSGWVYKSDLFVRSITKSKATISIYKTGAITGSTDIKNLTKI